MSTEKLYDEWASTYDTVVNKTRDLEKSVCRQILSTISFKTVIEFGCGTGKNTVWFATQAEHVIAVDFSPEMQGIARQKIAGDNVDFKIADITKPWEFDSAKADLITCSLILEHVENLDFVFSEASRNLTADSQFYVCELHPFRQYSGSKARFESGGETRVLECFTHHLSDFANAAIDNGFSIAGFDEWFDDNDRSTVPRLASFLFRKL